ncbi:MAG: c-type cytochrome [Pseudomonadota bacterium]
MKTLTVWRSLISAGILLAASNAIAVTQGDVEKGKQLSTTGDGSGAPCMACHGPKGGGNAAGGFPYIAGMNAGYLLRQMQAYQSGARDNAVMTMNVDNFDEQQLKDIAAYYASLPAPTATAGVTDKAQAELGERLVINGNWDEYIPPCSTCHGPGSRGVDENFPRIAGQHASYIKQQLNAWKNGTRQTDKVQLMQAVAMRLNDQQIDAVAAYLASLSAAKKPATK